MTKREKLFLFPPKHQPLLAKTKHAMGTASLKVVFTWGSGKGKLNSSERCQEQPGQVLQEVPHSSLMHLRHNSKSPGLHYSCSSSSKA